MLKKVLTVGLMCFLSLSMIFAGGAEEATASSSPKSIEVWMISNPDEKIINAFDLVGSDFTAKTGIEVTFVRTPTNDFHTKLVTSVSAGIYPDLIIWNSAPGVEFCNTGMVESMDWLIDEIGRDQFGEGALKMFTVDETLYEAPFLVRPAGLHARKDWLEKAGYDLTLKTDENGKYYVENLETYDDILDAALKINDPQNGKYGLGLAYSRKAFGDSAGFCFSVMVSNGARIVDDEGNLAIDTPEMRNALDYLRKVWESGAVPEAATTWDGNSNNQFFLAGDMGMVINSNSIMGKLNADSAVKPEELVILPLPKGTAGAYMQANPESITIFKTKNVEASKEFAKYLLQSDVQLKMFETMGFGYYSPLKKDVMNSPMFESLSANEKVLLNSGDQYVGSCFPGEPNAKLSAIYASYFYDDVLSRIAVDNWSNDQIIKEMEQKAKEMLFD